MFKWLKQKIEINNRRNANDDTDWISVKTFENPAESFTPSWDESNDYPILTSYGRRFIPMYAAHNMHYHTYFKIQEI